MSASTYDEMPYVRTAYPQSHPDRLATIATLFGLKPPELATCRVLELGCAAGDNLVPIAAAMPDVRCVGIDLSEAQIADGRAMVGELGLANIELVHGDIAAIDAGWGSFDYVIAHGLYSWVPERARQHLFETCRRNLAPDGIAYVSYNALPGWRMRGMVRDMMVYHAEQFGDAATKVQQARSLLEFIAQSASAESPYAMTIKAELDAMRRRADAYLFHEYLEPDNHAVYFHQFVRQAREHGLVYLGEASFPDMMVANLAPPVAQTLRRIGRDLIRLEQYMDFVRNRTFRQTLLVHEGVPLNRRVGWQALLGLHVASAAKPAAQAPDPGPDAPASFRTGAGSVFTTPHALVKSAMLILAERWPLALAFRELVAAARARLQGHASAAAGTGAEAQDAELLGVTLLQCYGAGVVDLHFASPRLAARASVHPRASALARLQARRARAVVNQWHEPVVLDPLGQAVLPLLDGTRDRAALLAALEPAAGALTEEALDICLSTLARSALLEA